MAPAVATTAAGLPADFQWVVIVGGITCFLTAFAIGANDVANTFSSSVGSRALPLWMAICLAAVLESVGATLLGGAVTDSIRSKIIDFEVFEATPSILMSGMLCALIGAGGWLFLANKFGLPVSTTHSVVGALLGFGLASGNVRAVRWGQVAYILISWILAPLAASCVGGSLFVLLRAAILRTPNSLQRAKRGLWFLLWAVTLTFCVFLVFKNYFELDCQCDQLVPDGRVVLERPCRISRWADAHIGLATAVALGISVVLTAIITWLVYRFAAARLAVYRRRRAVAAAKAEVAAADAAGDGGHGGAGRGGGEREEKRGSEGRFALAPHALCAAAAGAGAAAATGSRRRRATAERAAGTADPPVSPEGETLLAATGAAASCTAAQTGSATADREKECDEKRARVSFRWSCRGLQQHPEQTEIEAVCVGNNFLVSSSAAAALLSPCGSPVRRRENTASFPAAVDAAGVFTASTAAASAASSCPAAAAGVEAATSAADTVASSREACAKKHPHVFAQHVAPAAAGGSKQYSHSHPIGSHAAAAASSWTHTPAIVCFQGGREKAPVVEATRGIVRRRSGSSSSRSGRRLAAYFSLLVGKRLRGSSSSSSRRASRAACSSSSCCNRCSRSSNRYVFLSRKKAGERRSSAAALTSRCHRVWPAAASAAATAGNRETASNTHHGCQCCSSSSSSSFRTTAAASAPAAAATSGAVMRRRLATRPAVATAAEGKDALFPSASPCSPSPSPLFSDDAAAAGRGVSVCAAASAALRDAEEREQGFCRAETGAAAGAARRGMRARESGGGIMSPPRLEKGKNITSLWEGSAMNVYSLPVEDAGEKDQPVLFPLAGAQQVFEAEPSTATTSNTSKLVPSILSPGSGVARTCSSSGSGVLREEAAAAFFRRRSSSDATLEQQAAFTAATGGMEGEERSAATAPSGAVRAAAATSEDAAGAPKEAAATAEEAASASEGAATAEEGGRAAWERAAAGGEAGAATGREEAAAVVAGRSGAEAVGEERWRRGERSELVTRGEVIAARQCFSGKRGKQYEEQRGHSGEEQQLKEEEETEDVEEKEEARLGTGRPPFVTVVLEQLHGQAPTSFPGRGRSLGEEGFEGDGERAAAGAAYASEEQDGDELADLEKGRRISSGGEDAEQESQMILFTIQKNAAGGKEAGRSDCLPAEEEELRSHPSRAALAAEWRCAAVREGRKEASGRKEEAPGRVVVQGEEGEAAGAASPRDDRAAAAATASFTREIIFDTAGAAAASAAAAATAIAATSAGGMTEIKMTCTNAADDAVAAASTQKEAPLPQSVCTNSNRKSEDEEEGCSTHKEGSLLVWQQRLRRRWRTMPWFKDIHTEGQTEDELVARLQSGAEVFDAETEIFFSACQVVSACMGCIAHSANDTANAIGPFAAILTIYQTGVAAAQVESPWYVLLFGGLSMSLGLALLGYKVIKTVGVKLVKITPARGFAMDLGAAWTVLVFSALGIPLSTTHCAVGSTVGVGLMEPAQQQTQLDEEEEEPQQQQLLQQQRQPAAGRGRPMRLVKQGLLKCSCLNTSSVNWKLFGGVFVSWIVTILLSGTVSAALFSFAAYSPRLLR